MRNMNRCIEYVIGVATMIWSTGLLAYDNITYLAFPVSLHDGYTIEGGYITTNGTIGQLEAADIVDYEVSVGGKLPYVFSPSNPAADVDIRNVVEATRTVIQAGPGFRASNGLAFNALDNTLPDCTDCEQNLEWKVVYGASENAGFRHISYQIQDLDDGTPSILSSIVLDTPERIVIGIVPADFNSDGVVNGADFLVWQRGESFDPLSEDDLTAWQFTYGMTLPLTVAEGRGVPEPGSMILVILAVAGSFMLAKRWS